MFSCQRLDVLEFGCKYYFVTCLIFLQQTNQQQGALEIEMKILLKRMAFFFLNETWRCVLNKIMWAGGILFSEIFVFCVPTLDCVHTGDRMIKLFLMEVLLRRSIWLDLQHAATDLLNCHYLYSGQDPLLFTTLWHWLSYVHAGADCVKLFGLYKLQGVDFQDCS